MLKRSFLATGLVFVAGLQCNQTPTTPDNPPPPNAPDFGPVVTQAVPPPAISGGTMLLSQDGVTAIVADSDRDTVSFVDLDAATVRAKVDLDAHDEPGRIAEDKAGNVYVALRGTGYLATLSSAGAVLDRRWVCPEPRGVAHDGNLDQILVACATGELVTFPAGSGAAVSKVTVERDIRDVVLVGTRIFVSKFRDAQILELGQDRKIVRRMALDAANGTDAHVAMAWRMRAAQMPPSPQNGNKPEDVLLVSHQIDSTNFVPTTVGGYGSNPNSGTGGIVNTVMSIVSTDPTSFESHPPLAFREAVLPVDFAVSADGHGVLVAAGNIKSKPAPDVGQGFIEPFGTFSTTGQTQQVLRGPQPFAGQLVAAEVRANGDLVLQSREPAQLMIVQAPRTSEPQLLKNIVLSTVSREDTGHDIFHASSGNGIACASCHGEGGDDAQTWNFDGTKPRRTASLRGTVKGTAPYHWDADFADLQALTHEVYTRRMQGRALDAQLGGALKNWLEQVPAPRRPPVEEASRARGEALFNGKADCQRCHSGPAFTNNATVDVGTGKAMQVPPLVGVGTRLPLMHDGCAQTLTDRFTTCVTAEHGRTYELTQPEIADLVNYLDSL